MAGTNYFTPKTSVVDVALTDSNDNATLVRSTVANIPSAVAGYAIGCVLQATDSGNAYVNTGTASSCTFTKLDSSASSLTLPTAATDATTTTTNSLALTQNTVTTGIGFTQSLTGLTTGTGNNVTAAAATLTTGRYYRAFDGTTAVFGIGANGHIHTAQTTAPTIAVTTQNGITAAAVTAGGTDVAGIITTTGTNDGMGDTVIQVTFNKTYTTAPKVVIITPRNASAAKAAATSLATPYVSATAATTFDITIPSDASAGATPSFSYAVIA